MTDFIPAVDLKKKYSVKGKYYLLISKGKTTKCRNLLTITDKTKIKQNKLLIVMLNPGSSRPLEDNNKEQRIAVNDIAGLNQILITDAKPDRTQYQVMRVMNKFKFSEASIINLLDVREAKSKILFDNAKNDRIEHVASIFSDKRQKELKNHFTSDTIVILAWGNTKPISDLEKTALKKVKSLTDKIFMVRGDDNIIRHPSPLKHNLKLKWLDDIFKQLQS